MGTPARITTPFPTALEIAEELGYSKRRVLKLLKIADIDPEVVYGPADVKQGRRKASLKKRSSTKQSG